MYDSGGVVIIMLYFEISHDQAAVRQYDTATISTEIKVSHVDELRVTMSKIVGIN